MSSQDARKNWEAANNIETVEKDAVYFYDNAKQQEQLKNRPWKTE